MSDSLARALAAQPPAAQPFGNQDMLARILMGNPDPGLPQYPGFQSAEGRGFAPMPTSMGDMGARMGAVLRGQVEPTPGERYGMDVPLGWVAGSGGSARDGIRAYHGSPHQFDRFDMSRIGTGEGAQAYGHGLYFADNEAVARTYKDQSVGKRLIGGESPNFSRPDHYASSIYQMYETRAQAIKAIKENAENGLGVDVAADAIRLLRSRKELPEISYSPGHMYEVNLNTTPDRLLDWDAPLSGQSPQVRAAIESVSPSTMRYMETIPGKAGDYGGFMLADVAEQIGGNRRAGAVDAASRLREGGIDGIRYLDQGSRVGSAETRNYVMFDDKLIDILRRYGLAGMLTGGAASQAQAGEPAP